MSCLKTLARKHKKNLKWALIVFTVNVETKAPTGAIFRLPSVHEISQMNTKFLIKDDLKQPDAQNLFKKYSLRLHSSSRMFSQCAVKDCCNIDIEIHHVKKLGRRVNRKQIPLCSRHHMEFETGNYSPLDVNF